LGQTIPLACQDWTNTKAAYRFVSNGRVNEAAILDGHFQATRERFAATSPSRGSCIQRKLAGSFPSRKSAGCITGTNAELPETPAADPRASAIRACTACVSPGINHKAAGFGSD